MTFKAKDLLTFKPIGGDPTADVECIFVDMSVKPVDATTATLTRAQLATLSSTGQVDI